MASEQFSLCWDNFHKNMSSGMNSLLENEDLVDVTLAVQGKCLKAHKMVLSVCSPYFKELFKSNPCKHPIVFMKDVSYEALSDLLQFMYQGEVQVSQENLTTFIKTAEALQIKGLTGDGNGSADTDVTETPIEKPHVEEYKPTSRPKKQSAPLVTTPSIKRPRLSTSESQVPPPIAKTEPAAQSQSDSAVQFKMEPYDQSTNLIDDTGDDNFGDDNLDDTANDDNEDYSMMESSMTGEEEPQAGTSADGAGEGQGRNDLEKYWRTNSIYIFRQLSLTIYKLNKAMKNLNACASQKPNDEVIHEESFFTKFDFPLNSMEELYAFETYLKIEKNKKQVTKELSLIGGTNHKLMVKRLMDRLISYEIGQCYSWLGFKKKQNFSELLMSEVLLDAVSFIMKNNTRADIETAIKLWLVKCTERIERKHKKLTSIM